MFLFYSFRHYLLKIDMRQKVTKFKYKGNESFPKHLLFLEYILLLIQEAFEFAGASSQRTQNFMIIDLKKWSQTNLHLEPHDYQISYVNFDLHDQYGHLVPKCRIFPLNNSGHEERGKRVVFAGYVSQLKKEQNKIFINNYVALDISH